MNVEEKLQMCIDTLTEIKQSGYWPFASPAPCSTEVKIKDGFHEALRGLDRALFWHQQMFGKTGRDCMEPGASVIRQVK